MPSARRLGAAVALTSAGVMVLEVALTRALSVIHDYHYAFLCLSLAVFGLGLGGLAARRLLGEQPEARFDRALLGDLAGLAAVLWVPIVVLVPGGTSLPVISGLGLAAFTGAGAVLAAAFTAAARRSERIYAWDLAGAALGAVAAVPGLFLGAGNLIAVAGTVLAGATLLAAPAGRRRRPAVAAGLAVLAVAAGLAAGWPGPLPLASGAFEGERQLLEAAGGLAHIEARRWSHFGRTDLVADRRDPDVKTLFVDGSAGADLYRAAPAGRPGLPGGLPDNPALRRLEREFIGTRVLRALAAAGPALVIGPGGGRDVLVCRLARVEPVLAVELNPDVVRLVGDQIAFAGPVYGGPAGEPGLARLVVDEGRSYLRRSQRRFRLIYMAVPVTASSRSPEGYALSESFLFTRESIGEYLDHLEPDGYLVVIAHHDAEAVRLAATAIAALERRGQSRAEAMTRMAIVGGQVFPAYVLAAGARLPPATAAALARVHMESPEPRSEAAWLAGAPLPVPSGAAAAGLSELAAGRAGFGQLSAALGREVGPVTDDAPFFFKFIPGVPWVVSTILVLSLGGLLALVLPGSRHSGARRGHWIAAALGAGFMMVEIPLIQRFGLFLGRPVFALVVVLASLLLGASLGSRASPALAHLTPAGRGALAAGLAAPLALAAAVGLPPLLDSALGWPLAGRLALAAALTMATGALLGVPFPSLLRWLESRGQAGAIPRLWAVNGVASLAGSSLAIALAVLAGFTWALAAAAGLYAAAAALLATAGRAR